MSLNSSFLFLLQRMKREKKSLFSFLHTIDWIPSVTMNNLHFKFKYFVQKCKHFSLESILLTDYLLFLFPLPAFEFGKKFIFTDKIFSRSRSSCTSISRYNSNERFNAQGKLLSKPSRCPLHYPKGKLCSLCSPSHSSCYPLTIFLATWKEEEN